MTYEGHKIGDHECHKIGYGSRGERYLTERPCTCGYDKKKLGRKL